VPFTSRQREIIALVADGLSNTDIADRLTMSVRSVEGHLYRAAQRAGVSSRGELVAIHRGFHNTPRRDGPDEKA
jgi:DNA-binding CsgD family transcriptional regulator